MFRRYILSTFRTNSETYNEQLAAILNEDDNIIRGPYLQISHNFPKGSTIEDLIEEGVLSGEFRNLNYLPLMERPLYEHQVKAIRKVTSGRNVVVSTGTGSGKTESFLVPVLDYLMREKERGTLCPGVRVMLLYPLNALANDQIERLRGILSGYPDITFGTFTGETEDTRDEADRCDAGVVKRAPNEVYDRESFRRSPPHILITNYAMLEHLLIKPENSPLFGKPGRNHWRFIILDEAHTYTGAKGSEVSMLIRRLKATLGKDDLRFILTSATLGSDEQDAEVADFASMLCSSGFDESDVIRATHIPMVMPEKTRELGRGFYRVVSRIVSDPGLDVEAELGRLLSGMGMASGDPRERLYDLMYADPLVHCIAGILDDGPMTVKEVAERLGTEEDDIFDVMTAVSATRRYGDRVFNARYHLFVKGLDGAYVTLRGSERLFIHPRREYEDEEGRTFSVFQISTCYNCNAIYLLGNIKRGKFVQSASQSDGSTGYEPFLLLNNQSTDPGYLEEFSDEVYKLCSMCGRMVRANEPGCLCGPEYSNTVIKVSDKEKVCTCPVCGNRDSRRGLLRQLYLGNDSSTSVIASALFKDLLDSRDSRFLAFSDNRQSAAFFAPYMESTYKGILMKRVIYETMKRNLPALEKGVPFMEFVGMIKRTSADHGELLDDKEALEALVRECAQSNSRRSLEYLGFLRFEYARDGSGNPWEPRDMQRYGLSSEDSYNLFNTLVKFVRDRRAVTVASTDFAPYEYRRGFSLDGGKNIAKFFNESIRGYLEAIVGEGNAREFAKGFVNGFLRYDEHTTSSLFDLGRLNVTVPDRIYRCSRCNGRFPFSVGGRCIRCNDVTLEPEQVNPIEREVDGRILPVTVDSSNHYVDTVMNSPLRSFRMREHTAQLGRKTAREYQNLFRDGKLDALSCSTTFEMGVDIGTLNCVFLRNIPPSPANYIQRSGRAGRGEDASAFTVTFCREMSHDLTYFDDPLSMIDGVVGVPKIKPENPTIVLRHMFASAFNFYWRKGGCTPANADEIASDYDGFKAYLDGRPSDLREYLRRIVPERLCDTERGFDIEGFGWTDTLFTTTDQSPGRLYEAVHQFDTDLDILYTTVDVLSNQPKRVSAKDRLANQKAMVRKINSAMRSFTTLSRTDTISFLSNHNLIPKYGFPTDVVEMSPASGHSEDSLSRNMLLAISEYAPGSEVVVNGKKVVSRYITPMHGGRWIQYRYRRCQSCGKVSTMIDNFLAPDEDPNMEMLSRCSCGKSLENVPIRRFIRPDMGFKYVDGRMSVTEKPVRSHSTGISFCDSYDLWDSIHEIGGERIQIITRNNSRLVVVNETPFCVCSRCGYAVHSSKVSSFENHRKPNNDPCPNNRWTSVSLGYTFHTDVVVLRFISTPCADFSTAISVLYAIIEGFCRRFSVERNEIGGCLDNVGGNYSFVIYDNTPGGSGYVKLMADERGFLDVLSEAKGIVRDCKCGGEKGDTSCYSCLRNYGNQQYHDELVRRRARNFFDSLEIGDVV